MLERTWSRTGAFMLFAVVFGSGTPASARDTVLQIPLADVLAMPEAQGRLDGTVRFFLAGQSTPKVAEKLGEDVSNQKTNSLGKSDEFGCRWAILSALIQFQKSAKSRGADAVVDLVSYYKRRESKSNTTIECHAGNFVVGAALKGMYVKISK